MSAHATPDWWLGYLAGNIRAALAESSENARSRLRDVLRQFLNSPAASDELRQALNQTKPRQREPQPDGYSLAADWKPCANPECRAPIPRRSRKAYCDELCRNIAREYVDDEHEVAFRAEHPDYDRIPF